MKTPKKQTSNGSVFLLSALLLLLPNCAKYRPSSLPYPTGQSQKTEEVELITRELTDNECRVCFDTKKASTIYNAVQIYVKNNRKKPIVLATSNISLPVESSKTISHKIHRNTAGRAAGYGIGGLFLWPLFIPAAVDGAKSSNANYKINRDIEVKVIGENESITIAPNHSVNKVIFVKKENMKPEFTITLIEEENRKKITFTCKK